MSGGTVTERGYGPSGISICANAILNFSDSAYVHTALRSNSRFYYYNVWVCGNAHFNMTGGTIEKSGEGVSMSVCIDNRKGNNATYSKTGGSAEIGYYTTTSETSEE